MSLTQTVYCFTIVLNIDKSNSMANKIKSKSIASSHRLIMPFTIQALTMKSQIRIVRPVFLVISLLMLSTAVGSASTSSQTYWPTNGWEVSMPEQQAMNSTALQEVVDYVENMNNSFRSMVVVRHGYIVLEEYFSPKLYNMNDTHALYSATKSFVSCLFGIAMDMGFIDNLVRNYWISFQPKPLQIVMCLRNQ